MPSTLFSVGRIYKFSFLRGTTNFSFFSFCFVQKQREEAKKRLTKFILKETETATSELVKVKKQ